MLFLLRKISCIKLEDLSSILKLAITFLPAKIYKHYHPDIWVITEYPENARDNGYWLFRYIRKNYPKKEVYYPIKRKSSDYSKIQVLGNDVEFGGWKHYFLFWATNKFVGTTKYHGFPDERVTAALFELDVHQFKYIFLNHGFARGISNIVNGKNTKYDLVIAMSELEKTIMVKLNNQSSEKVKAIGFCRQDNLNNSMLDSKLIVVMPTWRRWLDFRHENDCEKIEIITKKYFESSYFQQYNTLINNKTLLKFLEKNDLKMILYLHGYAQVYSKYFSSSSERILIAEKNKFFVQDLLKKASFLVTDYSSVCFDYAYMKKPMVYFQFDAEEFAQKQYGESQYYTYQKNGFGPIVQDIEGVVKEIEKSYKNKFQVESKYLERIEEFFPDFDKNHCEKTYNLIKEL